MTPEYFRTVGIPLLGGRTFTERDDARAPAVAVVNDRFVDYYWPGESPLGRRITVFRKSVEIVGVVRTAKYNDVREEPQITIYFPAAQRSLSEMTLHARVAASAASTVAAVMRAAREIDPRVPVYMVGVLQDHVDARLANDRVLSVLSLLFACLALLVACAGLGWSGGLRSRAAHARDRHSCRRRCPACRDPPAVRQRRRRTRGRRHRAGHPASARCRAAVCQHSFMASMLRASRRSSSRLQFSGVGVVAAAVPARRSTRVDPIAVLRQQ